MRNRGVGQIQHELNWSEIASYRSSEKNWAWRRVQ